MKEKNIRVLKVSPDAIPEIVTLQNDLEHLQQAVGGLIEFVPIDLEKSIDLMCNEEGKLIGLALNRRVGRDIIVGDFYIIKTNAVGDCCSLSEDEIRQYSDRFCQIENISQEECNQALYADFLIL